jgi:hypothetical protein
MLTSRRSLAVLLFTCICGLMMNDVLRVDSSSGSSSSSLTSEDEKKNTVFGVITLILNALVLIFIVCCVAPEYRFVKRLIATIRRVRSNACLAHSLCHAADLALQSRIVSQTNLGFTRLRKRSMTLNAAEMKDISQVRFDLLALLFFAYLSFQFSDEDADDVRIPSKVTLDAFDVEMRAQSLQKQVSPDVAPCTTDVITFCRSITPWRD